MALITSQLGRLFEIRLEIYQKKFFMKFLNNFISQLTPFFFFSIGGYLVLQGSVSLGALVAALAAYKDLSSPWKELLTYYNQTQDMSLRWEVVTERFAPSGMLDEALMENPPDPPARLTGDIVLDHVTVRDADGNAVLDDLTATLPAAAVIGIAAPSQEDRRAFAELLVREVAPASGTVKIAGQDLKSLHQAVIAARVGRVTSRPAMFQGTFGDNVLMPIRRRPLDQRPGSDSTAEAERAGNSSDPLNADWVDPTVAGVATKEELRDWWLRLIDGMRSGAALFRRGLDQSFDQDNHPDLADQLIAMRARVKQAVTESGLERHVHFLDVDRYNPAMPVAENLLFATPRQPITAAVLGAQTEFMNHLTELKLDQSLVALTQDVIDMLRQIFGLDGTDHPLFRNLGLDSKTYETALELVERTRKDGAAAIRQSELGHLLTVPFRISAEQIGPAFTKDIKARILELRHSHSADFQNSLGDLFAPLAAGGFAQGMTVLENALFGKISADAGSKADDLRKLVADILIENGAHDLVVQLIYDLPLSLTVPTFRRCSPNRCHSVAPRSSGLIYWYLIRHWPVMIARRG